MPSSHTVGRNKTASLKCTRFRLSLSSSLPPEQARSATRIFSFLRLLHTPPERYSLTISVLFFFGLTVPRFPSTLIRDSDISSLHVTYLSWPRSLPSKLLLCIFVPNSIESGHTPRPSRHFHFSHFLFLFRVQDTRIRTDRRRQRSRKTSLFTFYGTILLHDTPEWGHLSSGHT